MLLVHGLVVAGPGEATVAAGGRAGGGGAGLRLAGIDITPLWHAVPPLRNPSQLHGLSLNKNPIQNPIPPHNPLVLPAGHQSDQPPTAEGAPITANIPGKTLLQFFVQFAAGVVAVLDFR